MTQRDIKFRVWDGYKMNYEPRFDCFCNNDVCGLGCNINDNFEDDNKTFMQYTGLKDKNGKEIYEGDIVTFVDKDNRGVVEWLYAALVVQPISKNNHAYGSGWQMDGTMAIEGEVIGNIWENGELQ